MNIQRLEEKLPHIVSNLKEIRLVYLFGSQVEGRLGPMSDYDLAVLLDPIGDEGQVHARLSHELACALGTDQVDVVPLNRAPIELAYAIIAQGKVLYQRDVATRVEYEAQVLSRYGDYLPVLRAQRDDIIRGDEDGSRVHRYRAALGRTERTLGQITATQKQAAD
ncbi:MAG: nucleotidyltransferase domain-containing protein [Anaerolineae bacterium]